MSKKLIQAVIDLVPELTDSGIYIISKKQGSNNINEENDFYEEQQSLLDSSESFEKTVNWLKQVEKIKNINPNCGSYGLKHLAEKDIGYITNGVFIAAAIHCGFKYKINPPNVWFNMSSKSLNKLRRA